MHYSIRPGGGKQKKGMTEAQIKEWASQRGLKSLYQTTQQQYAEAMKELGLK